MIDNLQKKRKNVWEGGRKFRKKKKKKDVRFCNQIDEDLKDEPVLGMVII